MNKDMKDEDVVLPEISDARIEEIEKSLFAAIHDEREKARARAAQTARSARTRRRLWITGGAAAAVIVVAAVIAPSLPGLLAGSSSGSMADQAAPEMVPGRDLNGADGGITSEAGGASTEESAQSAEGAREIIATAWAGLEADDAAVAAERIGRAAEDAGGYVEAMSIGGARPMPVDGMEYNSSEVYEDGSMGAYPSSSAWITVRVPASELTETITALGEVGEVTSSQIDRRDVTSEAVDLRARVDALEASVERLTALVKEADSTSDLIAAEDALASRQSDLESYQQQLKYLDEQVGMSTLTVSISEPEPFVQADPAGFGDGISAGWNGLLATLNGFVLALGFLLPWLAVIAVVALVVWAIRRGLAQRRERRSGGTATADVGTDTDTD